MFVFLLTCAEESMIHILLHTLESMVAEEVLGFQDSMTEVADIACTQPLMLSFKVQTHVIRFVGQMLAQPAAKLPIPRPICMQLHYVCTQRDQSQKWSFYGQWSQSIIPCFLL